MNTFDALLVAWNSVGKQQRRLTLSFATMVKSETDSLIPPVSDEGRDNTKKPEWKDQTTSLSPEEPATGQVVSQYPPPFEKCSKECNYCLQPHNAAGRGFINRCSEGPCYYSPDKQQYWYCYSKPTMVWCCIDGKVVEVTPEICSQKGGDAYTTEDEALKACQRDGWCCRDGKVGPLTQSRCRGVGGAWFATEKEAVEACATDIWCCRDGKVMKTTNELCAEMNGAAFATRAEAERYCQATAACWCCQDGKVFQTTTLQCTQYGGNCFATRAEAERYCQATAACWCCQDGKVFQTTTSQCTQYGGRCYSTQSAASKACYQTPTVK